MVLGSNLHVPFGGSPVRAVEPIDAAREYVRSVGGRRRQVWLRLAITLAVGSSLAIGTQDAWVPFWMMSVVVTQLLENAGFAPLLRGAEPTRLRIFTAVSGSVTTTTAFGLAAPLMWVRGGTEAGAGSIMFLFGGSMMALMAAQGSLPAFVGTVLPYLFVGTAMAFSPIVTGQSTVLSWPLVFGFVVLTAVMCLLWKWSARARRSEILARQEVELGRARAEAAERQVRQLAYSDALTGLPNRHSFNEALQAALSGGKPFALLLLDLNGFKRVNDRHGHPVGDEVLRHVASRLTVSTDGVGIPARLGGDEFAIICWVQSEESAVSLAWAIADSVRQPCITPVGVQRVGTSVGIALAPVHATEPSELMRRADAALYRSKSTGGAECVVFEPSIEKQNICGSIPGQPVSMTA
jgi:diguanylate cyclase (GGDEF)-like protein